MKILLLSDIHANYPALEAVADYAPPASYDLICNCGDTTVYAPFPNETSTGNSYLVELQRMKAEIKQHGKPLS